MKRVIVLAQAAQYGITELGIGQPPGSSHIFNERQQFPANADFKLLSFLSVGTKPMHRIIGRAVGRKYGSR